jgi:hypothetical protein
MIDTIPSLSTQAAYDAKQKRKAARKAADKVLSKNDKSRLMREKEKRKKDALKEKAKRKRSREAERKRRRKRHATMAALRRKPPFVVAAGAFGENDAIGGDARFYTETAALLPTFKLPGGANRKRKRGGNGEEGSDDDDDDDDNDDDKSKAAAADAEVAAARAAAVAAYEDDSEGDLTPSSTDSGGDSERDVDAAASVVDDENKIKRFYVYDTDRRFTHPRVAPPVAHVLSGRCVMQPLLVTHFYVSSFLSPVARQASRYMLRPLLVSQHYYPLQSNSPYNLIPITIRVVLHTLRLLQGAASGGLSHGYGSGGRRARCHSRVGGDGGEGRRQDESKGETAARSRRGGGGVEGGCHGASLRAVTTLLSRPHVCRMQSAPRHSDSRGRGCGTAAENEAASCCQHDANADEAKAPMHRSACSGGARRSCERRLNMIDFWSRFENMIRTIYSLNLSVDPKTEKLKTKR